MVSSYIKKDVNLAENFRVKGNGEAGIVEKISDFMEFENFEPDQMSIVSCNEINEATFRGAKSLMERGVCPRKVMVTSEKNGS